MAPKQLIVAVEGTAAVGPYWQTIVSDYLDKIIRRFCRNEPSGQKTHAELSLVMFNTHGPYSDCLVQRRGWTKNMDVFFDWLSSIPFSGGGFNDAAIAEGLAEALMMLSPPCGNENQNVEGEKHCILVAASNPYPLPTVVYRPQFQIPESIETRADNFLSDAETLATYFPQCDISLSIICTRQLPKLRGIYNAGKRDSQAGDQPVVSLKNPRFLVLISEDFLEARSSVCGPELTSSPSDQNPVEMDMTPVPPIPGPPPSSTPSGVNSDNMVLMTLRQQMLSDIHRHSDYAKIWEGDLRGLRRGQPVFIAKLQGFRNTSASETLAANWPPTMQIVSLISEERTKRQYAGKVDFLVFHALNQHNFLTQLQEEKQCAVIELPSQTLVLSVADEPYNLMGMLFDPQIPEIGQVSLQGPTTTTMPGGSFTS